MCLSLCILCVWTCPAVFCEYNCKVKGTLFFYDYVWKCDVVCACHSFTYLLFCYCLILYFKFWVFNQMYCLSLCRKDTQFILYVKGKMCLFDISHLQTCRWSPKRIFGLLLTFHKSSISVWIQPSWVACYILVVWQDIPRCSPSKVQCTVTLIEYFVFWTNLFKIHSNNWNVMSG